MWAAEHPHDLGALVLIGATADPVGPLTGVYRGFARALPHLDPERTARWMNVIFRRLGARGEHADLLPDGAGYAALPAAWQLVIDECGPGLLREVDCPVWLVNGQLDQMRLHVHRFADAAPDPRVVTVRRATHLMPATHPEQVAAVLRAAVAQAR
jgi:pimeloyl-ACP methyl ester carboxylesterase